jgi:hypothetical protein
VLKGLFGAIVGASGLSAVREANAGACAAEDEACKGGSDSGPDCCEPLICKHAQGQPGVCILTCGLMGDACEELPDCCAPDYVCNTTTGQCEAAAEPDCSSGADCEGDLICCGYDGGGGGCVVWQCCGVGDTAHCSEDEVRAGPFGCGAGKVCSQFICQAVAPIDCESDADCVAPAGEDAAFICCAGACMQIECCMEDEDPNARCGEGETCFEGYCDPVQCVVENGDCGSTAECCKDLVCVDGSCVFVEPEPAPGPDTGGVVTLPSTGAGVGADGFDPLLGVGLAAGATALLAAKKLWINGETGAE